MSLLHRDGPRRFPRPTSARTFPETYYNERHAPHDYNQAGPYAYPMGGPVSSLRAQSHIERDEFQVESLGSRRRVPVACARCRKRKIRCSGDKGDGLECHNCRQAGVDSSQCQFHRVGSDHINKVLDNLSMAQNLTNMASAHDIMPMYPVIGNIPYHRPMSNHQYPQLSDTKPTYTPDWAVPYGEDTSPVDSYSLGQSATYLPAPRPAAGSNVDGPPYRWTHPTARSMQPTTSYYSDYGHSYVTHGLPYLQTDVHQSAATEPTSPLDMSSLQLSLPERPRQRQMQPTEISLTPRRRLPAPQPNPSHGLHHALDQQQGQRLRSSQTIATPSFSNVVPSFTNASTFAKPLLPWTAANENLMNAVNKTSMAPPPITTLVTEDTCSNSPTFLPATTAGDDSDTLMGPASSAELNFSTSLLLDPSAMTAPTPPAYSNFRESRDLSVSSATQLSRNNSSSSLYAYGDTLRRPSFPGDNPSSTLVSGHQYTPLSKSTDTPVMEHITRESFERRASMSNLTSSF